MTNRLFPPLPTSALGRPLPPGLRRYWTVYFAAPTTVLTEMVEWMEKEFEAELSDAKTRDDESGRSPPPASDVVRDREALIRVCIEVRDLARSDGLRQKLLLALERTGVSEIEADGELFDPERHFAVEAVATDDAALHDRIAETELCGYSDRGRLVRPPEVRVYRFTGQSP